MKSILNYTRQDSENTFENFKNLDIFDKILKSFKIRTCYVFHFCCNVCRNYFCHHFICIIICDSEMETGQQWRRICSQVSFENLGQGHPYDE